MLTIIVKIANRFITERKTMEITTKKEAEFIAELDKLSSFLSQNLYDGKFYSFDDTLIVPRFLHKMISRKEINTKVDFYGTKLNLPIISSPMSFFGEKFAEQLINNKVLYSIPRINRSVKDRLKLAKNLNSPEYTVFSIGSKESDELSKHIDKIKKYSEYILIDIAHGASFHSVHTLRTLQSLGVTKNVIVGNIASVEGFLYLLFYLNELGFSNAIMRVGIGSGSACTTRLKTGVGFPQLSILRILHELKSSLDGDWIDKNKFPVLYERFSNLSIPLDDIKLIADGGIKEEGDLAKALIYSDLVMLGKKLISKEMDTYDPMTNSVHYFGMASAHVGKKEHIEGGGYVVQNPPSLEAVLQGIKDSLTSSLSYVNAENVDEFKRLSVLIQTTPTVVKENKVENNFSF